MKGFSVWSLLDTYEWLHGFSHKYGLYAVNFSDPTLPRTPKASSILYAQVCHLKMYFKERYCSIDSLQISSNKKVQVGNDQEKAQSKNRGEENIIDNDHIAIRISSYFPISDHLNGLNKNIKTYIRFKQHNKPT